MDSGRATATAVRTTRRPRRQGGRRTRHTGGPPGRASAAATARAQPDVGGAISGSPPGEPGSVDRGRAARCRGCRARPTGRWARRSPSRLRISWERSSRRRRQARPAARGPVAWGITVSSRAGSTCRAELRRQRVDGDDGDAPARERHGMPEHVAEIAGVRTTTRALAGTRRRSWLRSRFSSATVPSSRVRARCPGPGGGGSCRLRSERARSRAPRTCRPTRSPVRR